MWSSHGVGTIPFSNEDQLSQPKAPSSICWFQGCEKPKMTKWKSFPNQWTTVCFPVEALDPSASSFHAQTKSIQRGNKVLWVGQKIEWRTSLASVPEAQSHVAQSHGNHVIISDSETTNTFDVGPNILLGCNYLAPITAGSSAGHYIFLWSQLPLVGYMLVLINLWVWARCCPSVEMTVLIRSGIQWIPYFVITDGDAGRGFFRQGSKCVVRIHVCTAVQKNMCSPPWWNGCNESCPPPSKSCPLGNRPEA